MPHHIILTSHSSIYKHFHTLQKYTELSTILAFTTLLWPVAPVVMFNPMLLFSHCYFHGLRKIPWDIQLPQQQGLEMTMMPLLTGQEELLVWEALSVWSDLTCLVKLEREIKYRWSLCTSHTFCGKGDIHSGVQEHVCLCKITTE